MASDSSHSLPSAQPEFRIDPSMKIGYVSLNVSDLPRSIEFYESVLGFKAANRSGEKALLYAADDGGSSPPAIVELKQAAAIAGSGAAEKRAGLYHFAVLLPERGFLADALVHLGENRERVRFEGMADHLVSESIYIRDPDFNGIEIYCDRPRSQWEWDSSGRVQMATERLDTDGLLREASGQGWKGMPAGTTIGHVHLHVSGLEKASRFYSEALGLDLTCEFPGARFFAAGRYHHHVAANTWLGRGLLPARPGGVGLDHFAIELPSAKALGDAMKHLLLKSGHVNQGAPSDTSAFLRDDDGIAVRLYCRRQ